MRVLKGGRTIRLGDGERLENTLIKAQGEEVKITAHGDGWVIRNVGIEGPVHNPNDKILAPSVSKGGTGRIEHCYIGGEIAKNTNHMFVHTRHTGHLEIVDCFFGLSDPDSGTISGEDALYGSPPGNPEDSRKHTGQGGTIDVIRSYAGGAWNYGFRLGSDKSRIVDSVVNVPSSKGVGLANLYGEDVVMKNCDVKAGNIGLRITDHDESNVKNIDYTPNVHLENVRIDAPEPVQRNKCGGGRGQLHGEVSKNPDLTPPKSVPQTAKEAAQGSQAKGQNKGNGQDQDRGQSQKKQGKSQNKDQGKSQNQNQSGGQGKNAAKGAAQGGQKQSQATGQNRNQGQSQDQRKNQGQGQKQKAAQSAGGGGQGQNRNQGGNGSGNGSGAQSGNGDQCQDGEIETVDDFLKAVGLSIDSSFDRAVAALNRETDDQGKN